MWTYVRLGLLSTIVVVVLVGSAETGAFPGTTTRVSVSSAGVEGTGDSLSPAVNEDGRYVAFVSWAPNLVTGDTDACELDLPPPLPPIIYNCPDIFVRDLQASATQRVNVSSEGVEANGQSWDPAISHDGRYVAFESDASNLVSGDTNVCYDPLDNPLNCPDVFVRDRDTDGDGILDEPEAVSTTRVSVATGGAQANGASFQPAISSDGRHVAFYSEATNLVSGDTNGADDVFVRDRQTGTTTRVSVSSSGSQAIGTSSNAAISSDGRYVAFDSEATNLVGGDTNNAVDVFVRDRDTDGDGIFDEAGAVSTTRMSVSSGGSQGDGGSQNPTTNWNGRYIAFSSTATNLVAGDSNGAADVFVRDRALEITERVSLGSSGQGNGASYDPAVSWDGRNVVFQSGASNLVSADTNGVDDIFVRDRTLGATMRASVDSAGVQGDAESSSPAVSADGRYVAFDSVAAYLVPGDGNGASDVFLHDQDASPVGGIAELPDVAGRPAPNYTALAGLAAAILAALGVGVSRARRRRRA